MRFAAIPIGMLFLFGVSSSFAAAPCGPVDDPHAHSGYGGTPDLIVARGTGLGAAELQTLLGGLGQGQGDPDSRRQMVERIRRDASGSEAVLRQALFAHPAPWASAMVRTILEARKRAMQRTGDRSNLLEGLLAISPDDTGWGKTAVTTLRIYTLILALLDQRSLEGYKSAVEYTVEKEGVFRLEIGKLLVKIGLDTLPAVIYSQGSPNNSIREYAEEWFNGLGAPLLSEQVGQIKSSRRLAQLLEAYSANGDRDAIEVTLSLTNHDSGVVRRAARCSLPSYGRYIKWPIRRLYENTFEEVAPKEDPALLLEKIYHHVDVQREKPVDQLMNQALALGQAGNYIKMEQLFRQVLALRPAYSRGGEMVEPLYTHATELLNNEELTAARSTLSLALRVAQGAGDSARLIRAELLYLRAEGYRRNGVALATYYERVLELNPDHGRAKARYAELSSARPSLGKVALTGTVVSLLILLAVLMVLARLKESRR